MSLASLREGEMIPGAPRALSFQKEMANPWHTDFTKCFLSSSSLTQQSKPWALMWIFHPNYLKIEWNYSRKQGSGLGSALAGVGTKETNSEMRNWELPVPAGCCGCPQTSTVPKPANNHRTSPELHWAAAISNRRIQDPKKHGLRKTLLKSWKLNSLTNTVAAGFLSLLRKSSPGLRGFKWWTWW